jgi:hypothetical protein
VVWPKLIVLTVAVAVAVDAIVPSRLGGLDVVEDAVPVAKALGAELAGRCPVVPISPPPDEQAANPKGTTAIARQPTIQLHEHRFDVMTSLHARVASRVRKNKRVRKSSRETNTDRVPLMTSEETPGLKRPPYPRPQCGHNL